MHETQHLGEDGKTHGDPVSEGKGAIGEIMAASHPNARNTYSQTQLIELKEVHRTKIVQRPCGKQVRPMLVWRQHTERETIPKLVTTPNPRNILCLQWLFYCGDNPRNACNSEIVYVSTDRSLQTYHETLSTQRFQRLELESEAINVLENEAIWNKKLCAYIFL